MGWMCIGIHVVFIIIGFTSLPAERPPRFRLAGIYLISGLLALALSWLLDQTSWRVKQDRARKKNPNSDGQEGSVLIMVLIITALVSGLVLQAQLSARTHHRLEDSNVRAVRLRHAATDALRDALVELANDEDLRIDHPDEAWAQPRDRTDPSGIPTLVTIVDQNRFFDFNNLNLPDNPLIRSPQFIARDLLNVCGDFTPGTRVQALHDWVDENSDGLLEYIHYDEKVPPYDTPDRVMYGWNELLLIEAWDRSLFIPRSRRDLDEAFRANLVDSMTVIPVPRESPIPVNINTASQDTLQGVLGLENDSLVYSIVNRRKLGPIRNLDAANLAVDPNLIAAIGPYLSLGSSYFRASSTAYEDGHTESVEALVFRDTRGSVEILQWIF